MTMNRPWAGYLPRFLLVLAVSVAGCGHDPFGPPSRPKPPASAAPAESAKAVFMVLSSVPEETVVLWSIWAQRELNDRHLVFRVVGPGPDDPGEKQTGLIRKALGDGASALIVVPGDDPGLPQALADARDGGVPVVLLGRSIPAPAGSKPFPVATYAPFDESAPRIVKTVLGDAKKAGLPADGPALLLVDKETDPTSAERVAALKAAAEAAGIKRVETVPFDGSKDGAARRAVVEAIKSHPDAAVVLADDAPAMRGASQARTELAGKPAFFVAGYIGHRPEPQGTSFPDESCYVDGKIEQLARLAARQVIARLDGEAGKELSSPRVEFVRGSADVATGEKPKPAERPRPSLAPTP